MDSMAPYVTLFEPSYRVIGQGRNSRSDWDVNVPVPRTWHFAGLGDVGQPMGVDPAARDATSVPGGRIVSTIWAQRALNGTSYYRLQVDGVLGPATMTALQAYWRRLGSPAPQPGFLPSGVTSSGLVEDRVLIPAAMERLLVGIRQVADPRPPTTPLPIPLTVPPEALPTTESGTRMGAFALGFAITGLAIWAYTADRR